MITGNEQNDMPTVAIALNQPEVKKIFTAEDFEHIDKDELIFHLWRIIDNIDTFGDMAKSDDQAFRAMTEREQKKRWSHTSEDFVDYLYSQYYGENSKNGAPTKFLFESELEKPVYPTESA